MDPCPCAVRQLQLVMCCAVATEHGHWQPSSWPFPRKANGPSPPPAGLENDQYVRQIDGYLPTAEVAFIDEIFKVGGALDGWWRGDGSGWWRGDGSTLPVHQPS